MSHGIQGEIRRRDRRTWSKNSLSSLMEILDISLYTENEEHAHTEYKRRVGRMILGRTSLERMSCHNNLFTYHGCQIDKEPSILDRANIISIFERINMRLESACESRNMDYMLHSFIDDLCRERIEDDIDAIIERDDTDLELEWLQEAYIFIVSIIDLP